MRNFKDILKSAISMKVLAVGRTVSADPLQGFMFQVSIEGSNEKIGFQKVGGISKEIAVTEYLEGMYEHAHKLPGRESVGEITFERGLYPNSSTEDFYTNIIKDSKFSRKTVTISILNRQGEVKKSFNCAECWFSKYEVADLDATSDDVVIETLTMQFEYFN